MLTVGTENSGANHDYMSGLIQDDAINKNNSYLATTSKPTSFMGCQ